MVRTILFSAALFLSLCVSAQKYYLSTYLEQDGLGSSSVYAVQQDVIGQIWVGTKAGLHLFNGVEFRLVKRGIPSNYIRDIEWFGENLLVVSHDAGLSFLEPGLDTFHMVDDMLQDELQEGLLKYPNRLFCGPGGKLWISQPGGALLRVEDGVLREQLNEALAPDEFETHFSFAQVSDRDFLLASTSGRLYLFDGNRDKLLPLDKISPVREIVYRDGRLYAAGEDLSVARWDPARRDLQWIWKAENKGYQYRSLAVDTLGNVFVGTRENGLFHLSEENDAYVLEEVFSNNDPHRVDRLPFRNIHSIFVSADNGLWICSEEGLGLLQRRFFEGAHDLPNDYATALAEAGDGSVFVAMGDIYRIRKEKQEYFAQKLDAPKVGVFNALAVEGDELWAGTNTGFIVQMTLAGRLMEVYDFSERGAGVFRACVDARGQKWFCQSPREQPISGVLMIDRENKVHLYDETRGFDNRMLTVREGPRGEIYAAGIGAKSYLYKWMPAEEVFINMSIPFNFPVSANFEVHDIAIDRKGVVWMATTDGLLRHDMESVIRPDLGQEYTGKEIRSVAVLPDESLWLSTDIFGVLRYHDEQVLPFGEDSGLPTKIMAYRGMLVDRNGKLWVNTLEGVVHTSRDAPVPFPTPEPVLTALKYKGLPVRIRKDRETYDFTTNGDVDIDFISLTYPGELTAYQYRTWHSEPGQWTNLGAQHRATIPLDNPEITAIEIRGRKNGGYDWSPAMKIPISVRKPLHQRKGTYFLAAFAGLLILFLLWRANSKKYRRRIDALETQLKGMGREAEIPSRTGSDFTRAPAESAKAWGDEISRAAVEMLYEVTENTEEGMKWDHIMEHLSIALMKLPLTTAFEIASLNKSTNSFLVDGYSHVRHGFYQRRESWARSQSVFTRALKAHKLISLHATKRMREDLGQWAGDFDRVIAAPFIMGRHDAVLCIMGTEALDHEMMHKTLQSLAHYLELLD